MTRFCDRCEVYTEEKRCWLCGENLEGRKPKLLSFCGGVRYVYAGEEDGVHVYRFQVG